MSWWQRRFGGTTKGRLVALLRRGRFSVEELAAELGVTDNAVRAQLTALERDGVVRPTGIRREGGVGKPATEYAVTTEADALFSTAYAPLLASLLGVLGDRLRDDELEAILREAGHRLAPPASSSATFDERVQGAIARLIALGADADLVATDDGYELKGHGCVLAQAVAARPESCRAMEGLLEAATGGRVTETCDRHAGAPSCHFLIAR